MNSQPLFPNLPSAAKPAEARVTVTRVYNNGDRTIIKQVSAAEGNEEIAYSIKFRPGVALFLDNVCMQRGYLKEDRCAAISAELAGTGPATR